VNIARWQCRGKVIAMAARKKTRVLVIGLDGATFDLLGPWMKEGKLPTLARLTKSGVSGPLTSVFPPISPSAWTSFITGKNPGKHGVFDFSTRKQRSYERTAVNPNSMDGKTLWSILSESDRKVGVAYVPFAPIEKVNGFMIPGIFSSRDVPTYPQSLEKELREETQSYELSRSLHEYVPGLEDRYLRDTMDITEKIEDVTLHLMAKYPWDFLMTTFFYGDQIQHFFWKYMDPNNLINDYKMAKKYRNAILHYYQKIDNTLDRILRKADTRTTVIIMSDHGAGPVYKTVYINHWLMKKNLLKLKKRSTQRSLKRYLFAQLTQKNIVDIFAKGSLMKILSKIKPPTYFRSKYYGFLMSSRPTLSDVDWTRTKAYSVGIFGQVFINLIGREPAGIVKPGKEYEELRSFLVRGLAELKDPETDEKIVDKVFKREETYWGPHTREAADIIFIMKGMTYYTHTPEFGPDPDSLTEPPVNMESATHRMNGIFIITGPNIRRDVTIENARIVDVAPTVLHVMNVPIPLDMDGRVLKEIFEPESDSAKREVKRAEYPKEKVARRRLSEEERQIKERLKALGYLG